jgi:hypothetical protein
MSSEPPKVVALPRSKRPEEPTVALQALPSGMKHRFHAMVKPVGAMCNLDCTYGYYLHKEELLGQPRQPRMSDEMLERHIRQYIEAQTGDEVVFSWQGGPPPQTRPAHRERSADQRHAARRGVGGVPEAAQVPGGTELRRSAAAARPVPLHWRLPLSAYFRVPTFC